MSIAQTVSSTTESGIVPPQVANLPRREKEVAAIVYTKGPMTAKAIHKRLPRELSHSAVRSMLMRLCRKGVLRRRKVQGSHLAGDRRVPYIYSPAITEESVRIRAVRQLAQDYFDGSLHLVIRTISKAMNDQAATA